MKPKVTNSTKLLIAFLGALFLIANYRLSTQIIEQLKPTPPKDTVVVDPPKPIYNPPVTHPQPGCKPPVAPPQPVATKAKNRIALKGGIGRTGLAKSGKRIYQQYGPVVGIEYSRHITTDFSINIELLTNKTILLGVGYDF